MELNSVFGLPAHPLVVHGAVVLVPLAVLGFLATGWRPVWWHRYGLVVLAVSIAGWALAFLASQSGEPLEEHVRNVAAAAGQPRPRFGEHPEMGDNAALLSFVFAVGVAATYGLERWVPQVRTSSWMLHLVYAGTAMAGVLALAWMIRAGHSGAQLVWGK